MPVAGKKIDFVDLVEADTSQCLNPDNWWKTAAKGGVEDKVADEDMRDGLPTRLFTYVEGIVSSFS